MMTGKGKMKIKIDTNKFDEYEGQMENDQIQGEGFLSFSNGDYY